MSVRRVAKVIALIVAVWLLTFRLVTRSLVLRSFSLVILLAFVVVALVSILSMSMMMRQSLTLLCSLIMILKIHSMLIYCGKKKFSLSEIVNRPEVAGLISDLGLVFTGRSLVLRPRYIPRFYLDDNPIKRVIPAKPSRGLCERLCERNHHRKNFSNVYESNYNYKDLSFDWD